MPYVEYDEARAVCSECGRAFPDEEALAAHRRESHDVPDVTRVPVRPRRTAGDRRSTDPPR